MDCKLTCCNRCHSWRSFSQRGGLRARRSGERLFCPQLQVEARFDLRRVTGRQHSLCSSDFERHTFQHPRLEE